MSEPIETPKECRDAGAFCGCCNYWGWRNACPFSRDYILKQEQKWMLEKFSEVKTIENLCSEVLERYL
jgi:hypothetical protein